MKCFRVDDSLRLGADEEGKDYSRFFSPRFVNACLRDTSGDRMPDWFMQVPRQESYRRRFQFFHYGALATRTRVSGPNAEETGGRGGVKRAEESRWLLDAPHWVPC